jgi:hypothetical protein
MAAIILPDHAWDDAATGDGHREIAGLDEEKTQ